MTTRARRGPGLVPWPFFTTRTSQKASCRPVSGGPDPEASVDGWDVARALSRIPQEHREVLTLAYFEGLSQREISYLTGVPLGTIKSRTTAAQKRLHGSLVNSSTEETHRG